MGFVGVKLYCSLGYSPTDNQSVHKYLRRKVSLHKRLSNMGYSLTLTEDAKKFVAEKGFDPQFGARPLKRFIQHTLETQIGRQIIAGDAAEGRTRSADSVVGVG